MKKGLCVWADRPFVKCQLTSTCAVGRPLKGTHYYQVGDRYLRPKVLSGRRFRSDKI